MIVGNKLHGMTVEATTILLSTFVGVEIDGVSSRPNLYHGIYFKAPQVKSNEDMHSEIGSSSFDYGMLNGKLLEFTRVVVANNGRNGILACSRVTVHNAFIGVAADGVSQAGNTGAGIQIGCTAGDTEAEGLTWEWEADHFENRAPSDQFVYSAYTIGLSTSTFALSGKSAFVVVAGNHGNGIQIGKHAGAVNINHANIGLGSDGTTLVANGANGIEIAYRFDHIVAMYDVAVVANKGSGVLSKSKSITLASSYIGVLRNCYPRSHQYLDANLDAGNKKYGLHLATVYAANGVDAYVDPYGNNDARAAVSSTSFANNAIAGIYVTEHTKVTIADSFVGMDSCHNIHLNPQMFAIMIPTCDANRFISNGTDTEVFAIMHCVDHLTSFVKIDARSNLTMAYGAVDTSMLQEAVLPKTLSSISEQKMFGGMVGSSNQGFFRNGSNGVEPLDSVLIKFAEVLNIVRYTDADFQWYVDAKLAGSIYSRGNDSSASPANPSTTATAVGPGGSSIGGGDNDDGSSSNNGDTDGINGVDASQTSAGEIAAGVVVALLLFTGGGLAAVLLRRRRRSTDVAQAKLFREVADAAKNHFARNYRHLRKQAAAPDADSVDDMLVKCKSVVKMRQVGEGRRSTVYVGEMLGGEPVAIKKLRADPTSDAAAAHVQNADLASTSFLEEALLLRNLDHPNCLRVVGIVETPSPFTVLTQYCANGNLKSFLRACRPALASPRARLTTEILNQTAAKVTAGMVYLSSKSIVHRALAAHSILVGDTIDDIKLSRFGRSRDVYLSDEYVATASSAATSSQANPEFVRWLSPEAIRDHAFSYASDVFSAAVVFYEIFTYGRIPHGKSTRHEIMDAVMSPGFMLPRPSNCPDRLYAIMCECWQFVPSQRPNFNDLEAWLALMQHGNAGQLFQTYDDAHTVCLPRAGFLEALQKDHLAESAVVAGTTSAPVSRESASVTFESLAVRRSGLVRLKSLGSGAFGIVELMAAAPGLFGQGQGARQVAVKVLTGTDAGSQDAFMQEAKLMCKCRHPALVSILGVCIEAEPRMMILEFLPGGSLEDWLHRHHASVQLQHRAAILHQAAVGMSRLGQLGIVHRDLAARNILVGSGLVVKICDFGLSREGRKEGHGASSNEESYYRLQSKDTPLPLRWLAPEVLTNGMRFSSQTDVFSFGIVIWETFALSGNPDDTPFMRMSNQDVAMLLGNQSGVHMHPALPMPFALNHPVAPVLVGCVSRHPAVRPTFNSLADTFFEIALDPPAVEDGEGSGYLSVGTASAAGGGVEVEGGGSSGGGGGGGYAIFNNEDGSSNTNSTLESAL